MKHRACGFIIDRLISIFNNDWRVFGNVLKKKKKTIRGISFWNIRGQLCTGSSCLSETDAAVENGLVAERNPYVETQTRCCGRRECLMEMLGKAGGVGWGG